MEPSAPIHPESLLQHGPRLRALARRLVRDDHAADDLVQETWVRAVERGPAGDATPWRWLARVLRNLAFQDHRLNARRTEREHAVARSETGGDEGQRFGSHRDLVAAIEKLEEPYRQAILLRYFDALPPRKIAARLGVPVKTVKTRLNRGIGLLRAALDREHGGRERWMSAMLPLVRMGSWPWSLTPPALTAAGTLKLAAAAVVASVGLYWAWPRNVAGPVPVRELAAQTREPSAPEPARLELLADTRPETRVPSLTNSPEKATSSKTSPTASADTGSRGAARSTAGIRGGRVLDWNGNGLAGVLVGFDPGIQDAPEPVVSGAGGAFELPDLPGDVQSRDERFATVLISCYPRRSGPENERVVVVAPAVTLGGTVRDGAAQPRSAVQVRMEIPLSFRGRFREILDDSREAGASAQTDESGHFLLADVPGLACAWLVAWSGYESSAGVPMPEHDDLGLELVLSAGNVPPPGSDALHVVGEVRHWNGSIAPGALVSLAGVSTRADAEGLFELLVPPATDQDPEAARQLVAVARGEQAAILRPEHDASGAEVWPAFATLWLGEAPKSIAGRLIGTDGAPLAGAPVWIDDLTFLGDTHSDFLTLEHQLAGKPEGERWFVVRTDEAGRFELDGLGERAYTLAAMDPATSQVTRVGPIAAGSSDVEIALSREGLWARVAGRVVDTHGQPIAGQNVELCRRTFEVYSFQGGLCYGREQRFGAQTDENGRFELTDVPRSGMALHVAGQTFAPIDLELETVADPLDVRFEVLRLGHVQIELAGAAPEGGSIELLDEHDQPVDYYVFGGGSLSTRGGVSLGNANEFADGRTPVLSVPETARAVVLRDEQGNELRRMPLTVGESLTTVQL